MVCEIEVRLTCSLPDCRRVIARTAGDWTFGASLLSWIAGCLPAAGAAIDAPRFRFLAAGTSVAAGKVLDEQLACVSVRSRQPNRKLADRSHDALRLWRGPIAAFAAQLAIPIAGGIFRSRSL